MTTAAAKGLGEPAAAQDGSASAVTATSFAPTGARAAVWTKRAGQATWTQAGAVLPSGFGTSYDPAATAAPGGPLLVVAGTAPPGESCITGGSVAIASVDSQGRLGAARLVSDQRGTGSFDDRPTVAAGQRGTVWVAWSQGPNADACQDVGYSDRIEVAVSHDGGRTFGDPVAMPSGGGHSAFGVRLAPLTSGQVAVSWTETMNSGDQAVLVSVLGPGGQPGQPAQVLTGDGPPLTLPGASFYDFPAGDMAALTDGRLALAAPFWVSGRSAIKLAVGLPGGQWQETSLRPPAGTDLLLPALGLLSPGDIRVICAVHSRTGDRLGYDWADLSVTGKSATLSATGLTALTSAPPGPGFYEIGEELSLSRTPTGLLSAIVVAGKNGSALKTAAFTAPPLPAPSRKATPESGTPTAPGRAAPAGPARAQTGKSPRSGLFSTTILLAALTATAVLCCAAIVLGARTRTRRARQRRAGAQQAARHYPASRQAQYPPERWPDRPREPHPPGRWPDDRQAPHPSDNQPDSRQPRHRSDNWQSRY